MSTSVCRIGSFSCITSADGALKLTVTPSLLGFNGIPIGCTFIKLRMDSSVPLWSIIEKGNLTPVSESSISFPD